MLQKGQLHYPMPKKVRPLHEGIVKVSQHTVSELLPSDIRFWG